MHDAGVERVDSVSRGTAPTRCVALLVASVCALNAVAVGPASAQEPVGSGFLALTEPEFLARDAELQQRRRRYALVGVSGVGLAAAMFGLFALLANKSETVHVPGGEAPLMVVLGSGLVAVVAFLGVGAIGRQRRQLQRAGFDDPVAPPAPLHLTWSFDF